MSKKRRSLGKAARNEQRKLSAALVNAMSGAIFIVRAVQPHMAALRARLCASAFLRACGGKEISSSWRELTSLS